MSWWSRLYNAISPGRLDDEMAAEIEDHIERKTAALVADGCEPADARRRARAAFGHVASIRDQGRDIRLSTTVEGIVRDVWYACRGLRRNPTFVATTVLSLSLAIGALTAFYAIVDAAMLRALPVDRPDRLFALSARDARKDAPGGERSTFSYPLFRDLRAAAGDAAELALFAPPNRVELQASSDPSASAERVLDQFVSENAFEMLRLPPALGRVFSSGDAGSGQVVVISWSFWQRRFGGDPAMLDRPLRIDGAVHRVVGVAARGFFGVEPGQLVDVWRPASSFDPGGLARREFHWAHLVGRLADAGTLAAVEARFAQPYADDRAARAQLDPAAVSVTESLAVRAAPSGLSDSARTLVQPLYLLLAIAAATLLVACANVGSLLIARASTRSVEMAIRSSLGAGRGRLLRQLAIENLLLGLMACGGGWLLASLAVPSVDGALSNGRAAVRFAAPMDGRAMLFCAAISTMAALFFGALPAYYTAAPRALALRTGPMQPGRIGGRFVAAQAAFAYCLVACGAAFVVSVGNLIAIGPGFEPRGVTVLTIGADRMIALPHVQQFQDRLGSLPQIQSVSIAWMAIFDGGRRIDRVVVPGQPSAERAEIFYRISPGYFTTLRTPLVDGRDFTFNDTEASAEVPTIVNTAFARKYFDGGAVVGRGFDRDDGTHHRIIGVAADSHYRDLRHGPEPIVYFPMKPPRWFTLYVRSVTDAAAVTQLVGREARSLGSGAHVIDAVTLDDLVGGTMRQERLLAGAGGAFAALGLLLAAIGVFGFLNYSVASRTREIGIRCALGADRTAIVRLVAGQAIVPMMAGLIAGGAGAMLLLRFAGSLLFGVRAIEPRVFAATTAVFVVAALVAAATPARRAASIDPAIVFKS